MLTIEDLHVEVEGREVLHDINLTIKEGETHVLMGPNGSGKTTLLRAIMGFDSSQITEGSLIYNDHDITHMPIHERARLGIGLLFQRPPTVSGLKLGKLLAVTSGGDSERVDEYARHMNMDTFLERDINKGFSGGEIKRSEVLQLMIQKPDLVMLDEPESGVDLENMSLVGNAIASLVEKDKHIVNRKKSGLIITHTGYILDYIDADFGHVMCDGTFKCHGNPREILKSVQSKGYKECIECQRV